MSGVHPSAFVGPGVELGVGVTVGPFTAITGPCRIGDEVWIGPHASIGTPSEIRGGPHPSMDEGGGAGVEIGARTVVREFVVVNQGSTVPTIIGADCYLMDNVHVPHDALVGDRSTMAPNVAIAGHCWFGVGVNLGMGAAFHQFGTVGAHAMVGMNATVTRPIPPFAVAYGSPARVAGANRVGLARLGVDEATIERWHEGLRAGAVVGDDGPPDLAAHVAAYRERLAAGGG